MTTCGKFCFYFRFYIKSRSETWHKWCLELGESHITVRNSLVEPNHSFFTKKLKSLSKSLKEFLKENSLKNSIFEKTRFLLFEAYGPQKWSYEWFVRLFGSVLDCFWSFETHRHPKCSKILKISIFLTKPSKILYFELIWASETAGWLRVWL